MPRGPRFDEPGHAYHVTIRGIERREIFADDLDRAEFRRRLDRVLPRLGFRCFAWALMPNHVHLVVRSRATQLRRLMASLATGYAMHFNRRHQRAGHLLQNRYWSRPVEDDLETVAAYVHQNPVRAGLVRVGDLAAYPWAGSIAAETRREHRAFERAADEEADLAAPTASRPVAPCDAGRALRTLGDLEGTIERVCRVRGVARSELLARRRTRRVSAARAEIVRAAVLTDGLPAADVARALGLTAGAVSRILSSDRG